MNKRIAWKREIAVFLVLVFIFSGITEPQYVFAAKKVTLNRKKVVITVGKKVKLKLKNTKKKVKWTSLNKAVASVNKKGLVKAKKKGTAKIRAKVGRKKYICKITVKAKAAGGGGSKNPTTTPTAKPISKPKVTTTPAPGSSAKPTASPGATAMPTTTSTVVIDMPASPGKTLTVGSMQVTLGMSKSEVVSSIGAGPDRMDESPQGFDTYVYNPSGDYTNYLLISFAEDKVVGMSTISKYFSYEDIVFGQNSSDSLIDSGWSTSSIGTYFSAYNDSQVKAGTSACYTTSNDARVVAFFDYWGDKDVYGVQICQSGYSMEKMYRPQNGTYTDEILSDIEDEIYELSMAFRCYKGVSQGTTLLTRKAVADNMARARSEDMAENNSLSQESREEMEKRFESWLVKGGEDFEYYGENTMSGVADAIGFTNSFIQFSGLRKRLLNVNSPFQCIGVGVVYNSTSSYRTYATQEFYSLFD